MQVITQAFLFIDREAQVSSGNGDDFLSINIAASLKVRPLSSVIGEPAPFHRRRTWIRTWPLISSFSMRRFADQEPV